MDKETEECPRQKDLHVQSHRGGWKHGTFKGITTSAIREENGRRRDQGSNGREIWLSAITRTSKVGLSLDFTQTAMWSPKSAL